MEVGSVLSESHRLSGWGVFPKGKLRGCYKKLGEWKLGGQNQQMFSTVNMILRNKDPFITQLFLLPLSPVVESPPAENYF